MGDVAPDHVGHPGRDEVGEFEVLARGREGKQVEGVLGAAAQVEGQVIQLHLARLDFGEVEISLIMVSRASPEVRMVLTKSRWSALSGMSSSRLVMPMTPFVGVRISWDREASNSLLAREAWLASA